MDFCAEATPAEHVDYGIGSRLLQKAGWVRGRGLGRDGLGLAEPLQPVALPRSQGLGFSCEDGAAAAAPRQRKRGRWAQQPAPPGEGWHDADAFYNAFEVDADSAEAVAAALEEQRVAEEAEEEAAAAAAASAPPTVVWLRRPVVSAPVARRVQTRSRSRAAAGVINAPPPPPLRAPPTPVDRVGMPCGQPRCRRCFGGVSLRPCRLGCR